MAGTMLLLVFNKCGFIHEILQPLGKIRRSIKHNVSCRDTIYSTSTLVRNKKRIVVYAHKWVHAGIKIYPIFPYTAAFFTSLIPSKGKNVLVC